jgi:small-conductance mechanosensitive channel
MVSFIDELLHSSQALNSLIITIVIFFSIFIFFIISSKTKWKKSTFLSTFFLKEKISFGTLCALIVFFLTFPFQEFTSDLLSKKFIMILIIVTIVWFFLRLVTVIKEVIFVYFPIDQADNLQERKMRTQFQYIQILLMIIITIAGAALIFWQFDNLRGIGTGMLASAGVLGIVIAFAAQSTLGNLIAGFQIAFAQPFRIDDVVIVEGEWGRIEEITLTYVVVRIWDQRRLVVPISYFINNPFQNWTRTTADIWGTVSIYVDYSTPIEKMRKELESIVKSSELWDGKIAVLQVTDASERTMTLRALVSARNASDAWSLRCYVREKLIVYLQKEYPESLPKIRLEEKTK